MRVLLLSQRKVMSVCIAPMAASSPKWPTECIVAFDSFVIQYGTYGMYSGILLFCDLIRHEAVLIGIHANFFESMRHAAVLIATTRLTFVNQYGMRPY